VLLNRDIFTKTQNKPLSCIRHGKMRTSPSQVERCNISCVKNTTGTITD